MIAHYGYKDGSGEYFITIDTEKCNSCGDCVTACPGGVLEIVSNEFDIEGGTMVVVREEHRKKIRYSCAPCRGRGSEGTLPCVRVCQPGAIVHSW